MSDAHRASRREQILDAALRRIVRQGFHRTSMADIIEESGLSAGAIYLHFDSKQRIAIEAARRLLAGRLAEVEAETAGAPAPSPVAVIRALVAAVTPGPVPAGDAGHRLLARAADLAHPGDRERPVVTGRRGRARRRGSRRRCSGRGGRGR